MCPIFQVSNVTGENLDLLKSFLNLLSSRVIYNEQQPAEFQIDDTFSVPVSHPLTLLTMTPRLQSPCNYWFKNRALC